MFHETIFFVAMGSTDQCEMELVKQCVTVWIAIQSSSLNMKLKCHIVVLRFDYSDKPEWRGLEKVSSTHSIR